MMFFLHLIDPSNNSQFLQYSMLSRFESTLQISKCGSGSVSPNLVRHASLIQIRIHKARLLAGQLVKYFASLVKITLSWTNQFAPCCVNFIQNLILSSVSSNRCCLRFHHRIGTQIGFFEFKNSSLSFTASLDLNIDLFEIIVLQQIFKIAVHCHSHILIWIVKQCCVVFVYTQCRSRNSKFDVVFGTRSAQMQMSFSIVPGSMFQLQRFHFVLTNFPDIKIEPIILLVESTDSSCAKCLCISFVSHIGKIS